jgi:hypothetical protein
MADEEIPMPNIIAPLIPAIYSAVEVVSRELVGFAPSVTRNSTADAVAVGQTVTYPIAPTMQTQDVIPSMNLSTPPDVTFGIGTMAITKSKKQAFAYTGEEQKGLSSGGPGMLSMQAMQIAQAIRALVNEIEVDIALEAARGASRAFGTPGTVPFSADNLGDLAQVKKILDDNGAPNFGRSVVLNTEASTSLITQKNLTRVNEAGSQLTLRQGELVDLYGMSVKDTAGIRSKIKGTGAGMTTNAAGYAVGATVITLAAAGTGTVTAGDVVSFAGDTNKYVVAVGDADVSNGGTITLAEPGLRVAIPAASTAITIANTYLPSVAFSQDAIQLLTRLPAQPVGGDARIAQQIVVDPRSGLAFEFSIWHGERMNKYEVACAWGVKANKPNHIALLLG